MPSTDGPVAALGDFLDGEVELVAGDEVDRRALRQAFVRLHRHLGADEADLQRRVGRLQRRRHLHVGGEGRRRGVDHAQLVLARGAGHRVQADAGRRRVDQLAARHQRGRLGQPGRDTRRSGSPAAPGSASRRRRRSRRTRAVAGTSVFIIAGVVPSTWSIRARRARGYRRSGGGRATPPAARHSWRASRRPI